MKFIVDAQLPPALCRWLERRGHSAVHVGAVRSGRFPDAEIAAWAQRNDHIVISKDADFVLMHKANRCVLVRLRCGNLPTSGLLAWLEPRWLDVEARLASGQDLVDLQ